MTCFRLVALALVCALTPSLASAQNPPPPATQPAPQDQPDQSDPDLRVDALQPDFNLAALPTTLRMPLHKLSFRVTHRFTRPLGEGDFGDLASDLFGFDSGAQIGLELRYGLARGTQIGVHRTSDRDIQVFGQHSFLNERDGAPVGLDVMATLEGENNLSEHFQSALGTLVSRKVAGHLAVYGEPIFVINSNPFEDVGADNNTLMMGLGARWRVRPSMYLVGEITPRLAWFDPGKSQISFGLEGRAGGHLFQINFSNGFGTTLGQISRGAFNYNNWYIGFNIARKFF
jgi:uncharacterized beta barrel domain-containing protein DUF5777